MQKCPPFISHLSPSLLQRRRRRTAPRPPREAAGHLLLSPPPHVAPLRTPGPTSPHAGAPSPRHAAPAELHGRHFTAAVASLGQSPGSPPLVRINIRRTSAFHSPRFLAFSPPPDPRTPPPSICTPASRSSSSTSHCSSLAPTLTLPSASPCPHAPDRLLLVPYCPPEQPRRRIPSVDRRCSPSMTQLRPSPRPPKPTKRCASTSSSVSPT